MIDLSTEKILAALDAAVEEKGGSYVYNRPKNLVTESIESLPCLYVHDDTPGCLAGTVLYNLGVSLDVLATYEGETAHVLTRSLVMQGDATSTPEAGRLLNYVQSYQDAGKTWAESVQEAKSELGL